MVDSERYAVRRCREVNCRQVECFRLQTAAPVREPCVVGASSWVGKQAGLSQRHDNRVQGEPFFGLGSVAIEEI